MAWSLWAGHWRLGWIIGLEIYLMPYAQLDDVKGGSGGLRMGCGEKINSSHDRRYIGVTTVGN